MTSIERIIANATHLWHVLLVYVHVLMTMIVMLMNHLMMLMMFVYQLHFDPPIDALCYYHIINIMNVSIMTNWYVPRV
jgi:hypothetical protein